MCVLDKIYMEQSWARVQTVPVYLTIQYESLDFSFSGNFLI